MYRLGEVPQAKKVEPPKAAETVPAPAAASAPVAAPKTGDAAAKSIVTLSENAQTEVRRLIAELNKPGTGLRLGAAKFRPGEASEGVVDVEPSG